MNDPWLRRAAARISAAARRFLPRRFGAAVLLALSLSGSAAYGRGWTWDQPLPTASDLIGVWGSSGKDVFAVGDFGAIVHYDGSAWSAMASGSNGLLSSVWGSGGKDVFAVGVSGTILHYNGSFWSAMRSGTNQAVIGLWGSSGNDVYAVGDAGTILHYDGSTWSSMNSGTNLELNAVWGSSPNDLFAVGAGGTILHYDGSRWSAMTSSSIQYLTGVWGSSGSDVYAVGDFETILHYDGSSWSPSNKNSGPSLLSRVWGSSANDVYAAGVRGGGILHNDGTGWSLIATGAPQDLISVWGTSASDVFAVGRTGLVEHNDGSAWSLVAGGGFTVQLWGVWGSSASDVFAVGNAGTILHYDGGRWSSMASGSSAQLVGVWGSSGHDVFVVGGGATLLHYDGSRWSPIWTGTPDLLDGVWGSGANDVFVVGRSGRILHYDGNAWSPMAGGNGFSLAGVWGSGGSDVFAVDGGGIFSARSGTVLHYDGRGWSPMLTGPNGLWTVWGSGGQDVFAAGDGAILHYDGSAWAPPLSVGGQITGLWGSSGSDVYAATLSGITVPSTAAGSSLRPESRWPAAGASARLRGESASSDPVRSGILHFDGGSWQAVPGPPEIGGFTAVWGSSASDVIAVGIGGRILHYRAACAAGDAVLCLGDGRFKVTVGWRTPDGQSGPGHAMPLTGDTGYFWFFDPANVELAVKVLDACTLAAAPRFWVFAGGLTNVETTITVRDTATGEERSYLNPANTPFQPIQDTGAFSTCGAPPAGAAPPKARRDLAGRATSGPPRALAAPAAKERATPLVSSWPAAPAAARCTPSPTTLCLRGGRFRVDARWEANGQTGAGQGLALTDDTGYFWFFDEGNVEVVIKVLDACTLGRYWVFAGGMTNVKTTITVTDTATGASRTYLNPPNTEFQPIQDTRAFATCP
jgi:hypothetical protein